MLGYCACTFLGKGSIEVIKGEKEGEREEGGAGGGDRGRHVEEGAAIEGLVLAQQPRFRIQHTAETKW